MVPIAHLAIFVGLTITLAAEPQDQHRTAPNCPSAESSSGQQNQSDKSSLKSSSGSLCEPAQAKEPSASEKFPFPGESNQTPDKQPSAQHSDSPQPEIHHLPTADRFPFPGTAPPIPGASSSESSSSSSSSRSDNSTDDTAVPASKDNIPSQRRRLPKVEKLQSDEERAAEDIDIAKFYETTGDLNAAYLRARDAVKYQPSDPEAHFMLGHIAQKLNKREEATVEFNSYIQLEPDGQKIKQVRKALIQLQHP